jgi:hypothetical protein
VEPDATTFVLFAVLLAGAWFFERWRWRGKSRDKLIGMLHSGNWRLYKPAILELRRRLLSAARQRARGLLADRRHRGVPRQGGTAACASWNQRLNRRGFECVSCVD